jgi:hypothetical protein
MAEVLEVHEKIISLDLQRLGLKLMRTKPHKDPPRPWTERLKWKGTIPTPVPQIPADVVSTALITFKNQLGQNFRNAFAHKVQRESREDSQCAEIRKLLDDHNETISELFLILDDSTYRTTMMSEEGREDVMTWRKDHSRPDEQVPRENELPCGSGEENG